MEAFRKDINQHHSSEGNLETFEKRRSIRVMKRNFMKKILFITPYNPFIVPLGAASKSVKYRIENL